MSATPVENATADRRRSWRTWSDEYRRSLKPRELEETGDRLFCRPVAFVVAKTLESTPVTPDAVSIFAALWSLVVAGLYWQGDPRMALLGAAALFFWNVLDCVDGQLARMRGGGSPIGSILDQVVDILSAITLWFGLAHHLTVSRPGEHNWWLVCVVAALLYAMETSVLDAKRAEWSARVLGGRKSAGEELAHLSALAAGWRAEHTHLFGRFLVAFYVGAHRIQHLYLRPSDERLRTERERARFARFHKKALRLSTWLGPTTQMCALIVCTAFDRVDAYVALVVFAGVPWMALVTLVTKWARGQEQRAPIGEA